MIKQNNLTDINLKKIALHKYRNPNKSIIQDYIQIRQKMQISVCVGGGGGKITVYK